MSQNMLLNLPQAIHYILQLCLYQLHWSNGSWQKLGIEIGKTRAAIESEKHIP